MGGAIIGPIEPTAGPAASGSALAGAAAEAGTAMLGPRRCPSGPTTGPAPTPVQCHRQRRRRHRVASHPRPMVIPPAARVARRFQAIRRRPGADLVRSSSAPLLAPYPAAPVGPRRQDPQHTSNPAHHAADEGRHHLRDRAAAAGKASTSGSPGGAGSSAPGGQVGPLLVRVSPTPGP